MQFVWFWTFWHWSTESFRSGAVLRSPLQGVAGHWDEWYQHEASESDRRAIAAVARGGFEQRRFVCWLARRWAREARWRNEMLPARFVLAQLSRVAPFDNWTAFEKYRSAYTAPGISAIVLDQESAGEAADVRRVEAIPLPLDEDAAAGNVACDGFHADIGELNTARRAAISLLNGKGLIVFLGLWLVAGIRPYPRVLRVLLTAGWLAVVGLIARLLLGSDPGAQLATFEAILLGLWASLVVTAVAVAAALGVDAWRTGGELKKKLEESQLHLRMSGGLSVQGGSAGLAFCLNGLFAAYRSRPRVASRSWLWERFFRRLRTASQNWAATGIVYADGSVDHVVLEPKIRACLRNPNVTDVLTPWQAEGKNSAIARVADDAVDRAHGAARTDGPRFCVSAKDIAQPPMSSHCAVRHGGWRVRKQVAACDEHARSGRDRRHGSCAQRHTQCAPAATGAQSRATRISLTLLFVGQSRHQASRGFQGSAGVRILVESSSRRRRLWRRRRLGSRGDSPDSTRPSEHDRRGKRNGLDRASPNVPHPGIPGRGAHCQLSLSAPNESAS